MQHDIQKSRCAGLELVRDKSHLCRQSKEISPVKTEQIKMKCLLIFCGVLIFCIPAFAQRQPSFLQRPGGIERSASYWQYGQKPPLRFGRVTGEILLGGAGGIALGYAGIRLGSNWVKGECKDDLGCVFAGSILVLGISFTGWTLGTATGVYIAGNAGDETGSYLAAAVGALAGGFVGAILGGKRLLNDGKGSIRLFLWPPLMATHAFNATRRYKASAPFDTGFLEVRDGRFAFNVPGVYFGFHPADGRTLVQNVNLVRVSF